jgi:membrane protein implicated in regulation of membrane protease activity
MQRHATFIVALVASVAVVIVVPVIWHASLIAWIVSGILFVALVVALAMYFAGRRKRGEPLATNTGPPALTTIIGDVIGAHDNSIVMGNKVDSNINVYNTPPIQPVLPKDATGPNDS